MCKSLCPACSDTFSSLLQVGKKKYFFPTNLDAKDKKVVGIAIRGQNAAGSAKDSLGQTLAADGVLATAHLTLTRSDKSKSLDRHPVDYLVYRDSMFTCLQPGTLSLADCYIDLDSGASGFVAGNAIEVTLYYDCPVPGC